MKRCSACEQTKELEFFHRLASSVDGRTHRCKECVRLNKRLTQRETTRRWRQRMTPEEKKIFNRKRKLAAYGLTVEQYETMLTEQGGVCAICFQPETTRNPLGEVRELSVDHCHTTGQVRGLLCTNCNTLIGLAKESRTTLMNAINYLGMY